jgi:hypothetical protein
MIQSFSSLTPAGSVRCDRDLLLDPARVLTELALGTVGVAVAAANRLKITRLG